jgi:hypothetical protein
VIFLIVCVLLPCAIVYSKWLSFLVTIILSSVCIQLPSRIGYNQYCCFLMFCNLQVPLCFWALFGYLVNFFWCFTFQVKCRQIMLLCYLIFPFFFPCFNNVAAGGSYQRSLVPWYSVSCYTNVASFAICL